MIKIAICLLSILAANVAMAQSDPKAERSARMAEWEKKWALEESRPLKWKRIREIQPARHDRPLRYLNVSDEEVREIVAAAREVVPNSIVNISGVTTGCPCEEGPQCIAQVWIEAFSPTQSRGLQLSRMGKSWEIGYVQRWWLTLGELQVNRERFESSLKYQEAENALVDGFATCAAQPPVPGVSPTARPAAEPHR